MPDGPRGAVLFHYAEGRRPELDFPEDARVQGLALARLHDAADAYPLREAGRYRIDLEHLLHRPMAGVLALELDAPEACEALRALVGRLAGAVEARGETLTRTRCHGDCHGLNARIATAGPGAGQAILFDFDDSGFGYLAYDLAVHLWAQLSFGRSRYPMWQAFGAGYRSVRPVSRADEAALPVFVAIRHIWLMGEYAARLAEWGAEMLSAAWLKRELAWLLNWERDRLSPSLFD
jgi:Ser/Thr protein kinase RdoA (MazF antagonist)